MDQSLFFYVRFFFRAIEKCPRRDASFRDGWVGRGSPASAATAAWRARRPHDLDGARTGADGATTLRASRLLIDEDGVSGSRMWWRSGFRAGGGTRVATEGKGNLLRVGPAGQETVGGRVVEPERGRGSVVRE